MLDGGQRGVGGAGLGAEYGRDSVFGNGRGDGVVAAEAAARDAATLGCSRQYFQVRTPSAATLAPVWLVSRISVAA